MKKSDKNCWKRKCPKCDEIIKYSYKQSFNKAIKNNTFCMICSKVGDNNPAKRLEVRKKISENLMGEKNPWYGKKRPEHSKLMSDWMKKNVISKRPDVRKKISESNIGRICSKETKERISRTQIKMGIAKGENNSMYGRSVYSVWLEKYGKEEADKRQKETNNKMSESKIGKNNPFYGKKHSEESNKKRRLSFLKIIENRCGQVMPNYNPDACKIIDEYGKKNKYNFRHAENGGERCIDGYYPDGLDEKRKTIIEIDEPRHYDVNGNLKQKDVKRQSYLENKGYKVIRIKI